MGEGGIFFGPNRIVSTGQKTRSNLERTNISGTNLILIREGFKKKLTVEYFDHGTDDIENLRVSLLQGGTSFHPILYSGGFILSMLTSSFTFENILMKKIPLLSCGRLATSLN